MSDLEDSTKHEALVPLSLENAFLLFTQGFASWWPQEYTWSQDALETIGIELHEGGRCTEQGPEGFQVDWGRVLVWQPPKKISFTWQIGPSRVPQPNPANASTVEVNFSAEESNATRLLVEHRGFQNHGEGASAYRDALASEYGWPFILKRYIDAAGA